MTHFCVCVFFFTTHPELHAESKYCFFFMTHPVDQHTPFRICHFGDSAMSLLL